MVYIVGKGWGEGSRFKMDAAIAAFVEEEAAELFLSTLQEAEGNCVNTYGIMEARVMTYLEPGTIVAIEGKNQTIELNMLTNYLSLY